MAQFDANRGLIEHYARQARAAKFRGLFAVVSDPVDPLAKAAFLASNQNEAGHFDGLGLLAEQIQGFGLGVMNARAAYYAKKEPRFASFLSEGRAFGPHGRGLVIANSIDSYDDVLSRELTELALRQTCRCALTASSPTLPPRSPRPPSPSWLTLRGQWHYSSVFLGGVYLGVKNRLTPQGVEAETLPLPDLLYARLLETERALHAIL